MRVGRNGILLSVAEAAQLFHVPVGTLRRWAHEDGWERYGGERSRHWRLEQVQASYERRRAENEGRVAPGDRER